MPRPRTATKSSSHGDGPGPTPWRAWLASRAYFRLLNLFSGASIDGSYGNLSIISRKVVNAFLRLGDRDRNYLLALQWLGFENTSIEYEAQGRYEGQSSYNFRTLARHALNGLFFQSTRLLNWIIYLGLTFAATAGVFAVYLVISRLLDTKAPGWTSLAVLTLGVGGLIIVTTGVTGLYIGKVFEQVKGRPLYVIDDVLGEEPDMHDDAVGYAPAQREHQ